MYFLTFETDIRSVSNSLLGAFSGYIWPTILLCLVLSSCSQYSVEQQPSVNQNARIRALVFHYTASDFADAIDTLVNPGGVSAHYLLPENNDISYPYSDLRVFQLVEEDARAWHAGESQWQGLHGLNDQSIGIELVNQPDCASPAITTNIVSQQHEQQECHFPQYDQEQIDLLIALTTDILQRNPDIHPTAIVAHSDIAPSRKMDPGPQFPWFRLYQAGIGAWYDDAAFQRHKQLFNDALPAIEITQKALKAYGYGLAPTGVFDVQTENALWAFQTHFTPQNISGKDELTSVAALFSLLQKYFPLAYRQLIELHGEKVEQNTALNRHIDRTDVNAYSGQVDLYFPQKTRSSRVFVNDRATFKHFAKQGEIKIHNPTGKTVNADIFVNGQKLNLTDGFDADQTYIYPLTQRTRDGINILKVDDVRPRDGQLRIQIPFPLLRESKQTQFDFAAVDQLINQDIANGFPGAVLTIVKDGTIVKHSAYGYRKRFAQDGSKLANPLPMTLDTLFDIASNTKIFATTLAVKSLIESQQLELDKPIFHYLTEYRGQGREQRTVRHLLNHTSGYPADIHFFNDSQTEQNEFYSSDPITTKSLLTSEVSFVSQHQTHTQYSDINFMLLGILVERITQMPLDEYVEQAIFHPLGLTSTVFNPKQKLPIDTTYAATELNGNTRDGYISYSHIRNHTLEGEVHDEKSFYSMGGVSGHAGLFSTGRELAVLAQLLLNGGGYGYQNLFSHSLVNQFSQPSNDDFSMGLGFRRAGDGVRRWQFGPYASERAFGHTGWTGTISVIDPEHDLAIILLTNKRHSAVREHVDKNGKRHLDFAGEQFETGKYGSVVSLVYEAILKQQK